MKTTAVIPGLIRNPACQKTEFRLLTLHFHINCYLVALYTLL